MRCNALPLYHHETSHEVQSLRSAASGSALQPGNGASALVVRPRGVHNSPANFSAVDAQLVVSQAAHVHGCGGWGSEVELAAHEGTCRGGV